MQRGGIPNFRFQSQNLTTTTTSQTTTQRHNSNDFGILPPWLFSVLILFILILIALLLIVLILVIYYVIYKNRTEKNLRKISSLSDVEKLSSDRHHVREDEDEMPLVDRQASSTTVAEETSHDNATQYSCDQAIAEPSCDQETVDTCNQATRQRCDPATQQRCNPATQQRCDQATQASEEDQFQQNKNKMNSSNRTEQSGNVSTTSSASQLPKAHDQANQTSVDVNSSPKFEFSLNSRSSNGGISCPDCTKLKRNDSDCSQTSVKYPHTPDCDSFSVHDINTPLLSKQNETQLDRKSQMDSSRGLFDGAQCNADACVGEPETNADCRTNCNDTEERAMDDQMNHRQQPNIKIYDILKKISWVQGYFSEGRQIIVYVDFKSLKKDEQCILRYLHDITHDITQRNLEFRIADYSEMESRTLAAEKQLCDCCSQKICLFGGNYH